MITKTTKNKKQKPILFQKFKENTHYKMSDQKSLLMEILQTEIQVKN